MSGFLLSEGIVACLSNLKLTASLAGYLYGRIDDVRINSEWQWKKHISLVRRKYEEKKII
jgi:hypothetical protein